MTNALRLRPSHKRGQTTIDWLDSKHTFSFGHYYDPDFTEFGVLRVINEDIVHPGKGFETHEHRDMEIISVVVSGQLEHKDSLGNGSVIQTGDIQRMSAGTGIEHSEFNPSSDQSVHFLQIWIRPTHKSLEPSYAQKAFSNSKVTNTLKLVASETGENGSITVHQAIQMYKSMLTDGTALPYTIAPERMAWIQTLDGQLSLTTPEQTVTLQAGDGLGIQQTGSIQLTSSTSNSTFLLFDLPYAE